MMLLFVYRSSPLLFEFVSDGGFVTRRRRCGLPPTLGVPSAGTNALASQYK